jgi:methyl-accepting chemotaxis protein
LIETTTTSNSADEEIARHIPQLGKMGLQLKQTAMQIETSVVEVCQSFQNIAERAKKTVSKAAEFLLRDSATAAGNRSFESLLEICSQTIMKITHSTVEAGEISRQAIVRTEQMAKSSLQISAALLKLEHIATGNKILALNARIEAAQSGILGGGFAAVAVELSAQTVKSQEVTAEVSELATSLRALAEDTLHDLRSKSIRDQERAVQCKREVDASMDDLHSAHEQMKATFGAMTADGMLLADDIGRAVRGMQFQDRTNQRISHVVEDLEKLQAKLEKHFGTVAGHGAPVDEDFSGYTMREEREAAGLHDIEAGAGEVELF